MQLLTSLSDIAIALLAGFAGAMFKVFTDFLKIYWNTKKLDVQVMGRFGAGESIWVVNNSAFPIRDVSVYISIPNSRDKIVPPNDARFAIENNQAYIWHIDPIDIKEGLLCWASTAPVVNPPKADLCSKERKDCCLLRMYKNLFIEIASENGFSSDGGTSRALLSTEGTYSAILKVVSLDTMAKYYSCTIKRNGSSFLSDIKVIKNPKKAEELISSCVTHKT